MKNIIDIKIGKAFERISKKVTEWVKNIEMNKVYNRAGKVCKCPNTFFRLL